MHFAQMSAEGQQWVRDMIAEHLGLPKAMVDMTGCWFIYTVDATSSDNYDQPDDEEIGPTHIRVEGLVINEPNVTEDAAGHGFCIPTTAGEISYATWAWDAPGLYGGRLQIIPFGDLARFRVRHGQREFTYKLILRPAGEKDMEDGDLLLATDPDGRVAPYFTWTSERGWRDHNDQPVSIAIVT